MRDRFTHTLRVKYTRLLVKLMRHPWISGLVVLALFVGAVTLVVTGAVRTQFFAFDPIRLFYVNVDMPSGAPSTSPCANGQRWKRVVRRHLKRGRGARGDELRRASN